MGLGKTGGGGCGTGREKDFPWEIGGTNWIN